MLLVCISNLWGIASALGNITMDVDDVDVDVVKTIRYIHWYMGVLKEVEIWVLSIWNMESFWGGIEALLLKCDTLEYLKINIVVIDKGGVVVNCLHQIRSIVTLEICVDGNLCSAGLQSGLDVGSEGILVVQDILRLILYLRKDEKREGFMRDGL